MSNNLLTATVPQFGVKIDGGDLLQDAMNDVLEIAVESSLHLPDLCTLRIYDYDFRWIDSDTFKEGKALEVAAGYGQSQLKTIFTGEIVGVDLDLSAHHSATISVRAYDKSHRLHRGRRCAAFVQVTDSDVVGKIAQEAGLSADTTATALVRPWILQNNQTDWEFLVELAKRNGHDLFMKAGKLVFQKAGDRRAFNEMTLDWGENLRSFRPRTSVTQQMAEVEVRGWDPIKKQQIVGTAKSPDGVPKVGGQQDGAKLASGFGPKKTVVVDQPVHSQAEADTLAKSVRDQIGQDFLTADGLCDGTPELMAGTQIEIKNIGQRFSGKYYVSSATHTYSPAEGYTTQFSVSGTQPDNLLSLIEDAKDVTTSAIGGNIIVGVVTDNNDPETLGRVKVHYPSMGDDLASYWARIVSQMAGAGRGFFNLPEIGDEVLVAFEHGDPTRPYVLGQLWNGKDKPPVLNGGNGERTITKDAERDGDGKVDRRGYVSRIGHRLDFSDKDGKGFIAFHTKAQNQLVLSDAIRRVWLKTTDGHFIELSDEDKSIRIHSTGGHEILMDDEGRKITVTDSGGDSITMDATGGKITIKAVSELNLTAPKINVKADMEFHAEGGMKADVKGGMSLGLEGGTEATLKGGSVAVQGGTVDIKGGMVTINS